MSAAITSIYAALCGILIVGLAYNVTNFRRSRKVGMGDDGDRAFTVAVRAHANAVEYVPIALLLLLIAELNGLAPMWLHLAGAVIFIARVLHAWGFIASGGNYHVGRFWGTAATFGVIAALAATHLVRALVA